MTMSMKREPLLSERAIYELPECTDPADTFLSGGMAVREFYEDLITTGKLRLVEEVRAMPHTASGYEAHEASPSCSGCSRMLNWDHLYCPGCGNKIKR